MKINKKGMTLIELLVTVILIGLVLVFIFNLLSDLRGQRDNHDFAYDNQINRTEALYRIYNDLTNNTLLKIERKTTCTFCSNYVGNYQIIFENTDGDVSYLYSSKESDLYSSKESEKIYLNYKSFDGTNYKWEMVNAELRMEEKEGKICFRKTNESDAFILRLYIETNDGKNNNNPIDDIEITYYGPNFTATGFGSSAAVEVCS